MLDWTLLPLLVGVFLLAGAVKGVLGFGLPMVSLGLLTAALDLTTAISLLLIPSLVTNLWQAVNGGYAQHLWRRLWLFLLIAVSCIWAGTAALSYSKLSSAMLGGVLIIYALSGFAGVRYRIAKQHERFNSIIFGIINGLFTGMTGNFAFPGVLFLQGIRLPRDQLVQAMGMLFTLSTLGLAAAMFARGLLTAQLNTLSAVAVIPALAGMFIGQQLRRRLSEQRFRQAFFAGAIFLGGYIILKAIFLKTD